MKLPENLFMAICAMLNRKDGDFIFKDTQQIANLYNRKRNRYTEDIIYPTFRFVVLYLEGDKRQSLRTIIFHVLSINILAHREYANAYPSIFVITKTEVVAENANVPIGERPISIDNFKPFPKNNAIVKFFKQLGRFDELGSGVLNINNYLKAYSCHDNPQFIEVHPFKQLFLLVIILMKL